MPKNPPPADTRAIRAEIEAVLNTKDGAGRVVGNARFGIYAFYDYDGEPIYVGQTKERLRTRIRRHLTNQRTDAVAMNVLDPFEVCDIEMWPFFDLELEKKGTTAVKEFLDAAEYTVFQLLLSQSQFGAVLNEGKIPVHTLMPLPESFRGRIIPPNIYELRVHPDVRLARRASTIASLSRVISERQVQVGLRRTLVTQARRLEHLARRRFEETGGEAAYLSQKHPTEED
ncbi:MAG: GIY-YIG nuclease family protein [Dehalococcoidia bacterium]|nr:GIY-YIG nuclease family protein [Dehalococcoidia bacterium]